MWRRVWSVGGGGGGWNVSSRRLFVARGSVNVCGSQGASRQVRRFSTPATPPPRETPVIDFLEVHGGKVALGGLAATVYLMYTYYLGTQERRFVEENVLHRSLSEPYELLQLRYANNIAAAVHSAHSTPVEDEEEQDTDAVVSHRDATAFSVDLFRFIMDEFQDLPLSETTMSYREFVRRVQTRIVKYREQLAPGSGSENDFLLQSGYLLDRAVQQKLAFHFHEQQQLLQNDSLMTHPTVYSDIDNVLTVDWLLILLSQALPRLQYRQRVLVLFELMERIENSDSNLVDNEDNDNSQTVRDISRDTVLHLVKLLQDSDQLPPEKQCIETGVKHPVKLWRRKAPEDFVAAREKALKLETPRERWTVDNVFDLIASSQACAWGMCYRSED